MDTKAAYQKKMEAQLEEWNAKIDELKARAKKAEAERQADAYRKIDHLEAKRNELQAQMKELEEAGEGAWEGLKDGINRAAEKVKEAFDHIGS